MPIVRDVAPVGVIGVYNDGVDALLTGAKGLPVQLLPCSLAVGVNLPLLLGQPRTGLWLDGR